VAVPSCSISNHLKNLSLDSILRFSYILATLFLNLWLLVGRDESLACGIAGEVYS
jgi:hypothetical protein